MKKILLIIILIGLLTGFIQGVVVERATDTFMSSGQRHVFGAVVAESDTIIFLQFNRSGIDEYRDSNEIDDSSLSFSIKDLSTFRNQLLNLRNKLRDYTETARSNDIKFFTKDLGDIQFNRDFVISYTKYEESRRIVSPIIETYFTYCLTPSVVIDGVEYGGEISIIGLKVIIGELYTCMVFDTVEELDSLIVLLTIDNIIDIISSRNAVNALFD